MAVFNRYAHRYDDWYDDKKGAFVEEVESRLALDMLQVQPGMRVLDVGCGTGKFSLRLAQAGCQVTGVDVSEEMLDIARKKIADLDVDIRFLFMDAEDLEYGDDHFDAVVSMAALEFIPDTEAALEEMFRVTRPGGEILVGTINAQGEWGKLYSSLPEDTDSVFHHARFKSMADLKGYEPDRLAATGECLFISPDADEGDFTMEEELRLAGTKEGGFICALWRK